MLSFGSRLYRVELEQLVLNQRAGNVADTQVTKPFDPWARSGLGGAAPAPAAAPAAAAAPTTQYYNFGSHIGARVLEGDGKGGGKRGLYDEKYVMPPALAIHRYEDKKTLEWLQSLRD